MKSKKIELRFADAASIVFWVGVTLVVGCAGESVSDSIGAAQNDIPRSVILVESGIGGAHYDGTSEQGPRKIWEDAKLRGAWVNSVGAIGDFEKQGLSGVHPRDLPTQTLNQRLRKYRAQMDTVFTLQHSVAEKVAKDPTNTRARLIISGAHTTGTGTVAGIWRLHPHARMGLVWIDAHADINTPWTSPSGNPHGMPVAALTHLPPPSDPQFMQMVAEETLAAGVVREQPDMLLHQLIAKHWARYHTELLNQHALRLDDVVYVAARDLDASEKDWVSDKDSKGKARNFSVRELRASRCQSTWSVVNQIIGRLKECDLVVIEVDVDAIDEKYHHGSGTLVPNGLTPAEMTELTLELVKKMGTKVAAVEITEADPVKDVAKPALAGKTLQFATELTQRLHEVLH